MNAAYLHTLAAAAGLDLISALPAGPAPDFDRYQAWLDQGHAAGMTYLARPDAVERRADPRRLLPAAQTVLIVACSYAGPPLPALPALHGRVSRYAWGPDYHQDLLHRLEKLIQSLQNETGPFPSRCAVDTAAILERSWARAAGLGWIGRHTNLIHPQLGSYLFLGVALLALPLPEIQPTPLPDRCGNCTRCLDACPTGALVAPHQLDARRCLSYLTIEHRGALPLELRSSLGDRLFGCDACQEACPWNRRPTAAHQTDPLPALATLELTGLLQQDEAAFRTRFRTTPLWRATWEGLARNAAVVLGNQHDPAARPALQQAAQMHPSPLVREHALWALQKIEN